MAVLVRALCLLAALWSAASSAAVDAGAAWLAARIQVDGSYAGPGDIALPYQSTAEALLALDALGALDPAARAAGLAFLGAAGPANAGTLARKVHVHAALEASPDPWLPDLLAHQNSDGGFGPLPGYQSTILDTALVLEALAAAGGHAEASARGVAFLLQRQDAEGAWTDSKGPTPFYLCAVALRAVWLHRHQVPVAAALTRGEAFLMARRGASGLWGESFESARVLLALSPMVVDRGLLGPSLEALAAAPDPEGGWGGDVFATALAVQALIAASRPNPDLATVRGRVTDAASGLPLAGAAVSLEGHDGRQATAGSDGVFALEGLMAGDYRLEVSAHGGAHLAATVGLAPGQVLDLGRLGLAPGEGTAAVRGHVHDALSGAPLAGATVRVTGAAVAARTDATGAYLIAGLAPGAVTIEVTLDGYADSHGEVELAAGQTWVYSPALTDPDAPPGTGDGDTAIAGVLLDAATGMPLHGASLKVRFGDRRGTWSSRVDGSFLITGPTGRGELELGLRGYRPLLLSMALAPGERLDLGEVWLRRAGVDALLPDLTVESTDRGAVHSDPATLAVTGVLGVTVANRGHVAVDAPVTVVAFHDGDGDDRFDPGVDAVLGQTRRQLALAVDAYARLELELDGSLPMRAGPIHVRVDGEEAVVEGDEANNVGVSTPGCEAGAPVAVDLALCFDGSGSISGKEFEQQREGLIRAIADPAVVPRDGSVRLTLLQFSSGVGVELPPTRVDAAGLGGILAAVDAMRRRDGGTRIDQCIDRAAALLAAAEPPGAHRVIDVSTDGRTRLDLVQEAAERARLAGIDELNALGVGPGVQMDVLESVVYPRPPGGTEGFAVAINDYGDFARALADNVSRALGQAVVTVGALEALDAGQGLPVGLTARVGNAGTGPMAGAGTVDFYAGDPGAGGVWLGAAELPLLAPGQHTDVDLGSLALPPGTTDLHAVASADSRCDGGFDHARAPARGGRGELTLALAGRYDVGEVVELSAQLSNGGALAGLFTVELRVLDGADRVVTGTGARSVALAAGASGLAATLALDTTALVAGVYRLEGRLLAADGAVIESRERGFEVVHPSTQGSPLVLSLGGQDAVIHPGDPVTVRSLVGNTTRTTWVSGARLVLEARGPAGTPVWEAVRELGTLAPGARRAASHRIPGPSLPGAYALDARVVDPAGTPLARASTAFTVAEDGARVLAGSVEAARAELGRGETQLCTHSVRHHGLRPLETLTLRQLLVRPDDMALMVAHDRVMDLIPGEEGTWVHGIDTASLAGGGYACLLQARLDGDWQSLGSAGFRVAEPEASVDASLEPGARGRWLVLLEDAGGPSKNRDCRGSGSEQAFLNTVMAAEGWRHTVVNDEDAFWQALRDGSHAGYAILAGGAKFSPHLERELGAAVQRGEGLVVAEGRVRPSTLGSVLGGRYTGRVRNVDTLVLTESLFHPAASTGLVASHRLHRLVPTTAQVAGRFAPGGEPAVLLDTHGAGRTVLVGLPLLTEARLQGGPMRSVLGRALAWAHPPSLALVAGRVIPVVLRLQAHGAPITGDAVLAVPGEVEVSDASPDALRNADGLSWPFSLDAGEALELTAWIRLPPEPFTLAARVDPSGGASLSPQPLLLQPEAAPTPAHALAMLQGQRWSGARAARSALNRGQAALDAGRPDKALPALLQAIDRLGGVPDPGSREAGRLIAGVIHGLARTLPPVSETRDDKDDDGTRACRP